MSMDTTKPAEVGPVEQPVRPLVQRLRDAVQGLSLGADGMGWSPDVVALLTEAADELEDRGAAVDDWKERWRYERTHGCPHWGNHTSDGRERVCWYGGPERIEGANRLHDALKAVVNHWREFGPEHGMDECVDNAARALVA
jgi:hypothetical protein